MITSEQARSTPNDTPAGDHPVEDLVYRIAVELIDRTGAALSLDELHRQAVARLQLAPAVVNSCIYTLLKTRQIVEGSKLTRDGVLENPLRARLLEHVTRNPGSRGRDIRRVLDIDNAESAWHMQVLEKFGFLRSKRFGKYKSYYPAGMEEGLDEILCVLRQDTTYRVFYDIFVNPGTTASSVASNLGVDPTTVNYHVEKLVPLGLVLSSGDPAAGEPALSVNTELWGTIIAWSPGFSD